MRFMFIRRADKQTEAGAPPAPGVFDAMSKYHQEMAAAGILLDGVGLKPSRFGARISVSSSGKHSLSGTKAAGAVAVVAKVGLKPRRGLRGQATLPQGFQQH